MAGQSILDVKSCDADQAGIMDSFSFSPVNYDRVSIYKSFFSGSRYLSYLILILFYIFYLCLYCLLFTSFFRFSDYFICKDRIRIVIV